MFKKEVCIVVLLLVSVFQVNAQINRGSDLMNRTNGSSGGSNAASPDDESEDSANERSKKSIPSVINTWNIRNQGNFISPSELDTSLWFFHNYMQFNKLSISSVMTGNNGGAYLSNDFFSRKPRSDFYFARSFDAYLLTPDQINYFNTTTPFTLLDYTQSENKSTKNETRFNVFHSQNVNKKLNFEFIYNQTKSQGHYLDQDNKFHNIGIVGSYRSDKFLSHSNIIFNRLENQENGGIDNAPSLYSEDKTENFTVQMVGDAINKLQNNTVYTVNEYRLGKTLPADSTTNQKEVFIPRVGFIYEFELSNNIRKFTKENPSNFFDRAYFNSVKTSDSLMYNRLSNLFQIKFYEAPDRKYTFGKRAYIGTDMLTYAMTTMSYLGSIKESGIPAKSTNTFVGGGIFRKEGKFWQWEADGRIYLTGYRTGQTELNGIISKPIRIGADSTILKVEGSLKSLVPEYFDTHFFSNHIYWNNDFSNINELTIKSSVHSSEFKTTVGLNYSLIGNYVYSDYTKKPAQANGELLVLSAYLNKDFESKHWLIRNQFLVQKTNTDKYLHLPVFAGYVSLNYRTIVSKVLYTQLGIDTRYNSAYYADAYDPSTGLFYLQNDQLIGNYPYIDLHANLKIKRTRLFFMLINAASGLAGDNYYSAPDYPFYRRTFRLGVSWSFYD